ncbi:hypothetical protein L873DRAFT_1799524 [Choiromyces venosus 120613-1]|uniref:Uncharacterized protein n=1 Tax=Choiromyces venosus 120613-1 TaxID=1336337 RepID=A0A3N4K6L9_9PEZI|nr:hypothetical protein L873DRAFT_1799524 [Choiromyces venosus 120613-1]
MIGGPKFRTHEIQSMTILLHRIACNRTHASGIGLMYDTAQKTTFARTGISPC